LRYESLLLKDHPVICIINNNNNCIQITTGAGGCVPGFAFIAEFIDSSFISFISKFLSKRKEKKIKIYPVKNNLILQTYWFLIH